MARNAATRWRRLDMVRRMVDRYRGGGTITSLAGGRIWWGRRGRAVGRWASASATVHPPTPWGLPATLRHPQRMLRALCPSQLDEMLASFPLFPPLAGIVRPTRRFGISLRDQYETPGGGRPAARCRLGLRAFVRPGGAAPEGGSSVMAMLSAPLDTGGICAPRHGCLFASRKHAWPRRSRRRRGRIPGFKGRHRRHRRILAGHLRPLANSTALVGGLSAGPTAVKTRISPTVPGVEGLSLRAVGRGRGGIPTAGGTQVGARAVTRLLRKGARVRGWAKDKANRPVSGTLTWVPLSAFPTPRRPAPAARFDTPAPQLAWRRWLSAINRPSARSRPTLRRAMARAKERTMIHVSGFLTSQVGTTWAIQSGRSCSAIAATMCPTGPPFRCCPPRRGRSARAGLGRVVRYWGEIWSAHWWEIDFPPWSSRRVRHVVCAPGGERGPETHESVQWGQRPVARDVEAIAWIRWRSALAGHERHGWLDCGMEWREAKPRHRVIGLCELLSCGYEWLPANRWRALRAQIITAVTIWPSFRMPPAWERRGRPGSQIPNHLFPLPATPPRRCGPGVSGRLLADTARTESRHIRRAVRAMDYWSWTPAFWGLNFSAMNHGRGGFPGAGTSS